MNKYVFLNTLFAQLAILVIDLAVAISDGQVTLLRAIDKLLALLKNTSERLLTFESDLNSDHFIGCGIAVGGRNGRGRLWRR